MSDEQLVKHLGLDALQVGARRAGTTGGPRVLAWWSVHIEPSFARPWVVGAVHEEEWTGGLDPDRVTVRGFVADAGGAAVVPLDTDDVLDALGRLNPFRVAPTHRRKVSGLEAWVELGSRDGLTYAARWGTRATNGWFRFANPWVGWLEEFERVLFRFARRVVTAAGTGRFDEHLACWVASRKSVGHAEPSSPADPARDTGSGS